MKHQWIHNEIAVDADTVETLTSNGKSGDAKVTLCRGERVDGKGPEYWLGTNGDPMVITLEESAWSCSVDDAAEAVGVASDSLQKLMETHGWEG